MYLLDRLLLFDLILWLEQLVLLIVIESHAHPLWPQLCFYWLADTLPLFSQTLACSHHPNHFS